MGQDTLLHNAEVHTAEGSLSPGWVLVSGRRIAEVGSGPPPPHMNGERFDVGGGVLAPGLVDMHVHGALGYDTMDASAEALRAMARFYAQHGVTAFVASTMTGPLDAILAALETVARVMRCGTGGASLLGAHIEGPYIDVARRGAHPAEWVRPAQLDEYRLFFETGAVRMITIAPEFEQNQGLIGYAVERGAIAAVGHTRASYEQVRHAVDLGASQVTHLFNGMEPLHHRDPGTVGAALTLDALHCELIADGIHLHPAVLSLAVRAKGADRIVLVTDAMRGTGMPDGEYSLGGLEVLVRDGVARNPAGNLAGSTLTLECGVHNLVRATGVPLHTALRMASANPARQLGLGDHKGVIAPGYDADLFALDADREVAMTMVGGEIVYRRAA